MYSIEEIYQEAVTDRSTIKTYSDNKETLIKLGVMIRKFPNKIELINCHKGGDYFSSIEDHEMKIFNQHGWKKGVLLFSMQTYKRKLSMIEVRIQQEMNSRKNDKFIKGLKVQREKILNKYSNRQQQLNKLN
jgi:hypothetical protein